MRRLRIFLFISRGILGLFLFFLATHLTLITYTHVHYSSGPSGAGSGRSSGSCRLLFFQYPPLRHITTPMAAIWDCSHSKSCQLRQLGSLRSCCCCCCYFWPLLLVTRQSERVASTYKQSLPLPRRPKRTWQISQNANKPQQQQQEEQQQLWQQQQQQLWRSIKITQICVTRRRNSCEDCTTSLSSRIALRYMLQYPFQTFTLHSPQPSQPTPPTRALNSPHPNR